MMNSFELLNLPPLIVIDLKTLESAYFAAQRQYHPDRFVGKTPEEKLKAAQISADINAAYETLKHPLKRAKHLLELQGITVLDEANTEKPDQATLIEIMELQEAIAEGQKPDIRKLIEECEAMLSTAFEKSDINSAKKLVIRLSYLYKLQH